jgi:hypothetical protein
MRKMSRRKRIVSKFLNRIKGVPKEPRCIKCGRLLSDGELDLCSRCWAQIEVEAAEWTLTTYQADPDYRDNLGEADPEFRERYQKALEDLKTKQSTLAYIVEQTEGNHEQHSEAIA